MNNPEWPRVCNKLTSRATKLSLIYETSLQEISLWNQSIIFIFRTIEAILHRLVRLFFNFIRMVLFSIRIPVTHYKTEKETFWTFYPKPLRQKHSTKNDTNWMNNLFVNEWPARGGRSSDSLKDLFSRTATTYIPLPSNCTLASCQKHPSRNDPLNIQTFVASTKNIHW